MINHVVPKSSKFFIPYDFVQISPTCGSKYLSNSACRDLRFVSVRNGNIKCLFGKSIFAVNLPLKLYRATVVNTDTGCLKSLHTLFDTYLDHMLTKFEPNRMVRDVQKFELFEKKKRVQRPFRQSVDAILQNVSVAETIW